MTDASPLLRLVAELLDTDVPGVVGHVFDTDPAPTSSVICGLREAFCECVLPAGHDGLHECDEGCGGSWGFDARGKFIVGEFPSGMPGAGRQATFAAEPMVLGDSIARWAKGDAIDRAIAAADAHEATHPEGP